MKFVVIKRSRDVSVRSTTPCRPVLVRIRNFGVTKRDFGVTKRDFGVENAFLGVKNAISGEETLARGQRFVHHAVHA